MPVRCIHRNLFFSHLIDNAALLELPDLRPEIHEPAYTQKAWKQGKDDIGDTYVEVDMGEQMMYYYRNGKLELETPIVTGNTGRRWGTPEGVNYVYAKGRNRILRGFITIFYFTFIASIRQPANISRT